MAGLSEHSIIDRLLLSTLYVHPVQDTLSDIPAAFNAYARDGDRPDCTQQVFAYLRNTCVGFLDRTMD